MVLTRCRKVAGFSFVNGNTAIQGVFFHCAQVIRLRSQEPVDFSPFCKGYGNGHRFRTFLD
jgi:hypothetical protein